jgi:hypothetical protein
LEEAEVARTLIFGTLLGLDVEVNAVEASCGMLLIELGDNLDMAQERFAMFTGLVGFGAGEEGFNANVGAMEKRDEVNQLGFFRGCAALRDGNVDFRDVFGLAEA